jgi:HlyD family secretion protein/macrolide-specific efflux system membrane fusion protein
MTQTKQYKFWPWALGVLLVGGVALALSRNPGSGPEKVDKIDEALVLTVKRADLAIDVVETGKVQPREKVEVKSKVAGQVDKVLVEEGDQVKKGQLLLRLDPTDYRREVARCEADVAQAKNAIEFAKLTLERKQRGLAERGVAAVDVELAENDLKVKKVQLQTASVALAAAEDRLRYTQIESPMDGTVIQRGIQPGEVVTPGVQATFEGKPLLTVGDLRTLVVKAEFNQIDVARIALGEKVTLTLDSLPGKTFTGRVTRVAPASTQPKGKDIEVFPIEATVDGDAAGVRPGMTADLRVHIDRKPQVIALPIEAVVKEKDKSFVTRVLSTYKGKATTDKVEVHTGAKNDRQVEIVSGLKEGDRVLIKPGSAAENEEK